VHQTHPFRIVAVLAMAILWAAWAIATVSVLGDAVRFEHHRSENLLVGLLQIILLAGWLGATLLVAGVWRPGPDRS
jgi:hypothetical protein